MAVQTRKTEKHPALGLPYTTPQITVVNKHKDDDPKAIYIGRGSPLGNPYPIGPGASRTEVISAYKIWIEKQIEADDDKVCDALNEIAERSLKPGGVKLKCFCKPQACHGDIIRDIVLEVVTKG